MFILDAALRLFYGSALKTIGSFASDGDPHEISALDHLNGRHDTDFYRIRCRWHLIIKSFKAYCGDFSHLDKGVALTVLDQVHNMIFGAETEVEYNKGKRELDSYLWLNETEMTPSTRRREAQKASKQTTAPSTKPPSKKTRKTVRSGKKGSKTRDRMPDFQVRVEAMDAFVAACHKERKHLGHIHSGGHMTCGCTGTFRGEAEFSVEKTEPGTLGGKRKRSTNVGDKASLTKFFRHVGGLHDLREADKSIAVDKVAQKPPTEPFSKDTCELEEALSKHAHAVLVRTLGRIKDYNVWVVEVDEGKATKFAVRHKKAPMQTHSAFTVFHRTRYVDVNVCPTTHEERLKCTCPWTRMMGLPCSQQRRVHGGCRSALVKCHFPWRPRRGRV